MARRLLTCFGKGTSSSHLSSENHTTNNDSATADLTAEEQKRCGPVVVELFSSQGCATSPEAELLFSRIGRGDFNLEMPVILLSYHVDYWDYMGWKDPFGSTLWTVKQKAYVEALNLDTMFTPQVVVQGRAQCVGNEQDAVLSCINSAPRFAAPYFQATFERPTPEFLQVSLLGSVRSKVDNNGANVMIALYECGLVTDITTGENNGKMLANDYVVRKLEKLCSVKDITAKKTISGTVNFSLWDGFNSSKCGVALFVETGPHQICGSQNFKLPENL
ncbi:hypothetical protein RND71_037846 [Anisodus tanguticus]|uniref:Uncharacterized protein n=1 Tax=Anisodus tanguticus TaxID=243964 RepID=A0AAE1QYL5_9SOLA|nr:hypothetical protein RND71_037846 [Anisodus tanguticus]